MTEAQGEATALRASTAEHDKNATTAEESTTEHSQQQSKSSSTASNGSSQNAAQPTGDEPLLVHLVPSLKRATLPRGRIAHHDFLGRVPSMLVPSIESATEGMLRETQKWRLARAPVLGHRWIPESSPASTAPSVSCLPESIDHCLGYTDGEYHRYFESEEWSRPETDRLIGLWNSFGGRFVIIADRFNYGQGIAAYKTMEEIKERLVDITNRLSAAKGIERTILYDKGSTRHVKAHLATRDGSKSEAPARSHPDPCHRAIEGGDFTRRRDARHAARTQRAADRARPPHSPLGARRKRDADNCRHPRASHQRHSFAFATNTAEAQETGRLAVKRCQERHKEESRRACSSRRNDAHRREGKRH